jgi:CMP-N,N'-diacetyllegionaminic acid synthase
MFKGKRILGVIPARGGSKGIVKKNIRPVLGKPLIAYTIEATQRSHLLTRTIVSTDDPHIRATAKHFGADVPFLRPKNLAKDRSLALDVLNHAISALKNEGEEYDYVMMLQPTSPLRRAQDIDACITLAVNRNADSVFSMKRLSDFAVEKLKVIRNGVIRPFLQEEHGQSAPRHHGPDIYKRNCAIYLTKTNLIEKGDQFGKKSLAYVMPEERSLDINEHVDLELAEFWLRKLGHG